MSILLGEFFPYLAGLLALLIGYIVNNKIQRNKGRKDVITKLKEDDHEKAVDLRNDIERNLDDRVHDLDERGFRD